MEVVKQENMGRESLPEGRARWKGELVYYFYLASPEGQGHHNGIC